MSMSMQPTSSGLRQIGRNPARFVVNCASRNTSGRVLILSSPPYTRPPMADAPAHRPGRGRHSRRCGDPAPARLRQGIEEFNRGEFFEQHETLELEWLDEADPVRYLYQGILQIGVGFEHLRRGNAYGARRLWERGIEYLEPFRGGCMGVDVDALIADTERCVAELARAGDAVGFDPALVPQVHWLGPA